MKPQQPAIDCTVLISEEYFLYSKDENDIGCICVCPSLIFIEGRAFCFSRNRNGIRPDFFQ